MRYFILILSIVVFTGCCGGDGEPDYPHGQPDDISHYEGSNGYQSFSYTYHCYNGQYVSYSFVKEDDCADWEQDSKYTSDGICNSNYMMQKLESVHPEKRNKILEQNGFKVDTVYSNYGVSGKGIFN